ncbi:MAG TPA: DUF6328 family protein [Streptosporangiaceae bacterium]
MRSSDDRNESEAERDDRNLMELLQELRVAGLGVQVLFGFLLSLPFTDGFAKLSHAQRGLYIADLVLAAVATVLLVGPVAYHRLVFRQHLKEPLVIVANKMAIAGLAAGVISMLPSATGAQPTTARRAVWASGSAPGETEHKHSTGLGFQRHFGEAATHGRRSPLLASERPR